MQSDRVAEALMAMPNVMVGRLWQVLPDYPEYAIADDGTVVSAVRRPRVLKPIKRGAYRGFTLRDSAGVPRAVYLHRLVAEAFHGPCPDNMECRHLDGDKHNNEFGNLRWGTHKENVADTIAHGRGPSGERNGVAKLTRTKVAAMRRLRQATGLSYARIAKQFGVSQMTAYRAIRRQSWK